MNRAEPIEPLNRFSHQDLAGETWRAEIASRVNRYRAHLKNVASEEDSLVPNVGAQDFGIQSNGLQKFEPQSPPPANRIAGFGEVSGRMVQSARNNFDTHYYRRLNAESMAQISSAATSLAAAAVAPAREIEPESDTEGDDQLSASGTQGDEANDDLALNLEISPTVSGDAFLEKYSISEPEPELSIPFPELSPQGNLIVFRRPLLEPPLLPQPSRDELAEPMNNRPRILEVPEDIIPPAQGSLFPEIRLDGDEQDASSNREPEIEMPLRVAPISLRMTASMVDLVIVLIAAGMFSGLALHALPDVPHTKPFWMTLGAVTMLLWAVYQHLFLLYAGKTLGMSAKGIRLSTFDGRIPEWKQRSRRARFIFISFASVALGFLWALVDEDALCWHDRISQTFPTAE